MRLSRHIPWAVLLSVLALSTSPATAQTPVGDSVTGSGRDCAIDTCIQETPADAIFSVDAHSGPSGENPTGDASVTAGLGLGRGSFFGTVTCMSVSGNVAVIGIVGRLVVPFFGIDVPASSVITVRDGGGEASGLDRFASTPASFGQPPPPPDCSLPPTEGGFVNDLGDLVVRDVVLPTSKDQCENGDFAQFGFKNQGQCVAFVVRGPKP